MKQLFKCFECYIYFIGLYDPYIKQKDIYLTMSLCPNCQSIPCVFNIKNIKKENPFDITDLIGEVKNVL